MEQQKKGLNRKTKDLARNNLPSLLGEGPGVGFFAVIKRLFRVGLILNPE
jgi:hypothetical protein